MTDMINHPPHYTATEYEPIDIIAAIGNPYCRGNALKYLARAGRKGDAVEDLKKARWYVKRVIADDNRGWWSKLLRRVEPFKPMDKAKAVLVAKAWSNNPLIRTAIEDLLTDGMLSLQFALLNIDLVVFGIGGEP